MFVYSQIYAAGKRKRIFKCASKILAKEIPVLVFYIYIDNKEENKSMYGILRRRVGEF